MGPANVSSSLCRALPLAAAIALATAACGPEPLPPVAASAPQGPASTIYVIFEPEAGAEGWVPEDAPTDNPFSHARTWVGDYDCPQGNTNLTVQVLAVAGPHVKAVFEFHHVESGDNGAYLMSGTYDGATRKIRFVPGAWIRHPPYYVSVGMTGDVADDGSLFAGRMMHPKCGAFRLRPAG